MKLFGKKNRSDRYAWLHTGANYLVKTNPNNLNIPAGGAMVFNIVVNPYLYDATNRAIIDIGQVGATTVPRISIATQFGISNKIAVSGRAKNAVTVGASVNITTPGLICITIIVNLANDVTIYANGIQGSSLSLSAQTSYDGFDILAVGYKAPSASSYDYYNGLISSLQIINFIGGASSSYLQSIAADANNRATVKTPFAKSYSGGTIILDQDPKNNGRDTSAYGNHLTPVGTPPPGIIRI